MLPSLFIIFHPTRMTLILFLFVTTFEVIFNKYHCSPYETVSVFICYNVWGHLLAMKSIEPLSPTWIIRI